MRHLLVLLITLFGASSAFASLDDVYEYVQSLKVGDEAQAETFLDIEIVPHTNLGRITGEILEYSVGLTAVTMRTFSGSQLQQPAEKQKFLNQVEKIVSGTPYYCVLFNKELEYDWSSCRNKTLWIVKKLIAAKPLSISLMLVEGDNWGDFKNMVLVARDDERSLVMQFDIVHEI